MVIIDLRSEEALEERLSIVKKTGGLIDSCLAVIRLVIDDWLV